MRIPDSIVLRTSLLYSTLTAAVVLLMGFVVHLSVDHHFADMDRLQIEGKLELIRNILNEANASTGSSDVHKQLDDALVGHHDLVVQITHANGSIFFSREHSVQPENLSFVSENTLQKWSVDGSDYRGMSASIPKSYRIVVGINISHHQQFLHHFKWQLLQIGLCGSLAMAILGWFAARRGLKPVQDMALVVAGISAQRLHERLSIDHIPFELHGLALSFNAMLDRLGNSLQRLSEFSSDIAHELRTPISNLMTQTQVSLSKPRTLEQYREILYSNLDEYERLSRMIADMLFLAKADHGLDIPNKETINLRHEIEALLEFYDALLAEKNLQCTVDGVGELQGDSLMLRRAISNVLSNAIRHSMAGSIIKVFLQKKNSQLICSIANQGDTITPEQLPRLFDRFYRADASRQRSEEGAGLGLAITRSIIEAHGGSISFDIKKNWVVCEMLFPKL